MDAWIVPGCGVCVVIDEVGFAADRVAGFPSGWEGYGFEVVGVGVEKTRVAPWISPGVVALNVVFEIGLALVSGLFLPSRRHGRIQCFPSRKPRSWVKPCRCSGVMVNVVCAAYVVMALIPPVWEAL